jgi:hypothetical protein
MAEYDLESNGNILTKPVMGWSISHAAGAALLLTIHYADTPEELQRLKFKPITLALTPILGLEIAEALKKHSQNLIDGIAPPGTQCSLEHTFIALCATLIHSPKLLVDHL